jgi:predicted aspartyl protease
MTVAIDRRAGDLLLPSHVLSRIGAQPSGVKRFKRSNGQRIETAVGMVNLTLGKQTRQVACIHGDQNVEPILGDRVLEPFELMIDPKTGLLASIESQILRSGGEGRSARA